MGRILLYLFIFCAALETSFSQPVRNSSEDDTLSYTVPFDIIISAPRSQIPLKLNPAATAIVGKDILSSMPRAISVDEALRLVPGVRIDNQADGERVHMSIRGQGILTERGIRGIKVLFDGLPLNDPSGFAPDFYDVDWSNVDKVEVLRGPAASLYGGGASAGVINITSRYPSNIPLSVNADFTSGSYNFWKTFFNVDGTVSNMGYSLALSRMAGNGYREHTRYDATNVFAKSTWEPVPEITLRPLITWTKFFNENAEGLNNTWMAQNRRMANPDAITFNEFQETERFTGGLSGEIKTNENQQLEINGFFRRTLYKEPVPSSVQHRTFFTPGISLQYNLNHGSDRLKNYLSVGTDLQWQSIDEYKHPNLGLAVEGEELLSNQSIKQSAAGIFFIDRLEINPEWGVMLSLRYDKITNKLNDNLKAGGINLSGNAEFEKTTGRIGLTYSPAPYANLYLNWGQGFLPPATEELANNPEYQGGFNRNLLPATSNGEEFGIRGTIGKGLYYDADVFYLITDKDFDRYRISSRPLETFYRNTGSSRRFGLEGYIHWIPLSPITLQTSYSYSNFKYTTGNAIDGNILPNSPEHMAYVDVAYRFLNGFTLGLSTELQSRWYVNTENTVSVGGFTLFHARLSYKLNIGNANTEISLYARNITGREYIAFTEPDPDGNSFQPGPGREIFGSIKVGF